MTMREGSFVGLGPHGFHGIAYTEWGDPGRERVVVCAHGLTRSGRDFDFLARALEGEYRVVCVDFPGRGRSQWLPHPQDYAYPVYLADMACLIARLNVGAVDWVGTSMGGLVGMMLAAQPNSPIRRLVLNDVGPLVPKAALERIKQYVGSAPEFDDLRAVEEYLRQVHAPFGPLTDEQWRHLAEHSARRLENGRYALHYDPAIAVAVKEAPAEDVDLWPVWDQIRCPVLVIRGAESDVLLGETLREMRTRGPETEAVELAGIGHAPTLMDPAQIGTIREWLAR